MRSLSFDLDGGEFVGLVGESGAGKSVAALAVLGLVPSPGRIASGSVRLAGCELRHLDAEDMRRVRGARIAMIFQEPAAALDPVFTIGSQIVAAIRAHCRVGRSAARRRAVELLDLVAMPSPRQRLNHYPDQLSGGQQQRAMIAIALAAEPELLLADEPTTALDVTVQAEILELLDRLRRELGLAVLLITHDLAVVAGICDRAVVVYAGQAVETGSVEDLFAAPAHPYTRGLLAALPRLGGGRRGRLAPIPGQVPDPARLPAGCAFHPRCAEVMARCALAEPPVFRLARGGGARCFLHAPEEPASR